MLAEYDHSFDWGLAEGILLAIAVGSIPPVILLVIEIYKAWSEDKPDAQGREGPKS